MLMLARQADNDIDALPKEFSKDSARPELQALIGTINDLAFAVAVIEVPDDGLDRCEFCPGEDETGTQPLDAVASIVTRPEPAGRVYREATCAGCAPTVLHRDHRRGLTRVWVEIPAAAA